MKFQKPVQAQAAQGVILTLYVQPGASKTGFAGLYRLEKNGVSQCRIKVKVAGKAVEGEANASLVDFLARNLRVAKSSITLTAGQRSREKTISIKAEIRQVLEGLERAGFDVEELL